MFTFMLTKLFYNIFTCLELVAILGIWRVLFGDCECSLVHVFLYPEIVPDMFNWLTSCAQVAKTLHLYTQPDTGCALQSPDPQSA